MSYCEFRVLIKPFFSLEKKSLRKFTNADNSPTEIPFYRQSNRVMHLGSVAFKESREDAAVKTFTMESIN